MIAYLEGSLLTKGADHLVIKTGGVGYEVFCSQNTVFDVEDQDLIQLFIHTHVREDSFHLFGFSTPAEKQMFESLIKISGIGPKSAIHILSAATLDELYQMIEAKDAKALSKLPKVGKKTAEQMILSLKGKLVFADEPAANKAAPARDDIISALIHLGFKANEVEPVVRELDPKIDVQEGVRQALAALSQ